MKKIYLLFNVSTSDDYIDPGYCAVSIDENSLNQLNWLADKAKNVTDEYKKECRVDFTLLKISVFPFFDMHFFDEIPDELADRLYDNDNGYLTISKEQFEDFIKRDSENSVDPYEHIIRKEGLSMVIAYPKHFHAEMWFEFPSIYTLKNLMENGELV